ncbi:hypothetical protein LVJ83_09865 [Uruburuella testudinis]|uniref:Uncharacterized protein n=1 Tax=Uruburuella testudinis TaxID=1282863 RepID=A0ABY4DQN6_9NEIS|nr:hypothetical protein [Uruburuella testudinis]UOO81263.1 hypothetical protein LVJ83_09865 [Uruburuella testudinis]
MERVVGGMAGKPALGLEVNGNNGHGAIPCVGIILGILNQSGQGIVPSKAGFADAKVLVYRLQNPALRGMSAQSAVLDSGAF